MEINEVTNDIISSAIEVHKALGPGLLESAYRKCLMHELELRGISAEQEVFLPLDYKGLKIDQAYKMDIVVGGNVVLELKAVDRFHSVHTAQLLSYLKIGNYPVGLLLNFNVALLKQGIKRIINTPL